MIGLSSYFNSISDYSRVTADEEKSLARQWREHRDASARERLITANLRLVIALAKRYAGRGVPLDELIAEGNVGLIHAVDNFDPDMGCRISTYAAYWIRQSIGVVFSRAQSRARISRQQRQELAALDGASGEYQALHGCLPTAADLAEALSWEVERVRAAQRLGESCAQTRSLSDTLPVPIPLSSLHAPDEQLLQADAKARAAEQIDDLLAELSPLERRLIELHFGLDCGKACPVGAVASILGMSKRNVNGNLRLAMVKLLRHRGSAEDERFESACA